MMFLWSIFYVPFSHSTIFLLLRTTTYISPLINGPITHQSFWSSILSLISCILYQRFEQLPPIVHIKWQLCHPSDFNNTFLYEMASCTVQLLSCKSCLNYYHDLEETTIYFWMRDSYKTFTTLLPTWISTVYFYVYGSI